MQKVTDTIFETIDTLVALGSAHVLEIGAGNGKRTVEIAKRCVHVEAVEPDAAMVAMARETNAQPNITYTMASADVLPFEDDLFEVTIFTLSLHHVPPALMTQAIDEAVRVTKQDGHIIFIEPTFTGSCFEAEILFDAWDGDERRNKALAYAAMLGHAAIKEVTECSSEMAIQFQSVDDFITSLQPKRDVDQIGSFLDRHGYILTAQRRINVFRLV